MDIEWIDQSVELVSTKEELELGVKRIEKMGRICYQSHHRNKTGEVDKDFIMRLIKMGHESVLEHMSISFIFITDRITTHQLVRHRLCSFSQESQRYCMYKDTLTCIIPETGMCCALRDHAQACFDEYLRALDYGKMKAEDARIFLPPYTKTQIGVTANLREWRNIFKQRLDKHAQPQIRNLMNLALDKLKELGFGWLFSDINK